MKSIILRMAQLLLGLSVVLAGCQYEREASEQTTEKEQLEIYALMGQSNMAGRGEIDEIANSYRSEDVLMMTKEGELVEAAHPVHFDKPKIVAVGPGLKFAYELSLQRDKKVVIVPCAVGGTNIDLWEPGKYDSITDTHPYDDAIDRVRKAMDLGELKGVIWHQGEANRRDDLYMEKLATLIARIREVAGNPQLPFVAGELGYFLKETETFNRNLQELPKLVDYTAVVSAEGLTHKGDDVHFDARSAELLGKRYAEAMSELIKR